MPTGEIPQNDPNVKIPGAIKRAAANADEIHKQVYTKEPAPAEPTQDQLKEQTTSQPVTTEGNEPSKDAPPGISPPSSGKTVEELEHALKSINGRYTRANETIRNQNERIRALEAAIEQRDAEIAELKSRTPLNVPPDSTLTPKEIEDYGEDFLKVVAKQAKQIAAEQVAGLEAQIVDLKKRLQNVGQTVKTNSRDAMKAELTRACPNWQEINVKDEFLAWLGLRDKYSRRIRHELLTEAWNANDTQTVLEFFNGFLAEEAANAPNTKPDNPLPSG